MTINDDKFEKLLTAALYRAGELDSAEMPSDGELEHLIQPSLRFRIRMKSLLRNPNRYLRNQRRPVYMRVLRTAASAIIILAMLLGAAMAVSPTVRAMVIDFVRSWLPDRTVYEVPIQALDSQWSFGYIPEGFELLLHQDDETGSVRVYQNINAVTINIIISHGKQVIDNEHAEYYQTIINDRFTDVYESSNPDYPSAVMIHDRTSGVLISIISEISINELLKIVENIN